MKDNKNFANSFQRTSTPINIAPHPGIAFSQPLPVSNIQLPAASAQPPVANRRYTGCILEWKGTFGYITCYRIPGDKIKHFKSVGIIFFQINFSAKSLTLLFFCYVLDVISD
jgi:hypothetical protein